MPARLAAHVNSRVVRLAVGVDPQDEVTTLTRDAATRGCCLWRREGGLVVGLAVEHAGVPAKDLVAEPLQGDQADGAAGVGVAVGAE
jgi:hypothetical protein